MLIPLDDGGYVNLHHVISVQSCADPRKSLLKLLGGGSAVCNYHADELDRFFGGTVVPAQPGYVRLYWSEPDGAPDLAPDGEPVVFRAPIIAWRICGSIVYDIPAEVDLNHGMRRAWLRPDGTVQGWGSTYDNEAAFLADLKDEKRRKSQKAAR